ncbi:S1/P1 nuclease [Mucilaginibacter ximonensis]|uniref:S1/P1 nuclease n=1 Tax=Mucilaginibacter ximonensis TaxID=538021 RepID=A0ABW5Y9N5_9SPHI
MKRIYTFALLIGTIILTSWGFKGHQAVGTIAENHLTPQAKAAVKELLGNQSLADVATWADEVREEPAFKSTEGWHFVNVPSGLTEAAFSAEVKAQGENNVYGAMQKARIVLTHPKSSREQKIEALKFLVHFVGDAHQPMHISHKEDKGGNTIQVRFDNAGTNLHTLWDSKLLDHQGLSVVEMSQQYDKATPDQIKAWQQDQPMTWLWESYVISSKLYTEPVDAQYYQNHIGIVQMRIDQAGIRLAGILNDIYSGKVYASTHEAPLLPGDTKAVAAMGPAKVIDIKEAASHLNETVTITAKVYGTKDVGSMILVNVGAPYPDSPLTVVLRGDTKSLAVDGKTITVTGQVIDYKGKPEIIVTDKNQVKF